MQCFTGCSAWPCLSVLMVLFRSCRQRSSITRVMTASQSESVVVQLASLFRIWCKWTHWEAGRYNGMKTKISNKNLGPSFGVVTQPHHPFKTAHQVADFHCWTNARSSIRSLSILRFVFGNNNFHSHPGSISFVIRSSHDFHYWQRISLKLIIRCLGLIRRPDRVEGLGKGNAVHRSFSRVSVVKRQRHELFILTAMAVYSLLYHQVMNHWPFCPIIV